MSTTRPFTPDEQRVVLESLGQKRRCLDEINSLRDQVFGLAGLLTGFRVTELLRLTVGHVWRKGTVVREITLARRHLKGGAGAHKRGISSRTVPVHDSLRALIQTYISCRFGSETPNPDLPLFPSPRHPDRAISRMQGLRIIKGAAQRVGIDTSRVATHSLRKAFADEIFRKSGHNLPLLQKALGHRCLLTTVAYISAESEEVNAAILGMAGKFETHRQPPYVELVKPLRLPQPARAIEEQAEFLLPL